MNVAVLGYGQIVPEFLEAVRSVSVLEPCVLFGREASRERVEKFAACYRIDRVSFDYDELLADKTIDVVYVALPNDLHYEYAKKALESGKHVIVEKPFAATCTEAKDLVETARANNVIVFEAITNQYFPNYEETKDLIGELGEIRVAFLNFSQYSHRYDSFKAGGYHPVFDPEKYGGALMDLNVYNIHFVTGIFGKPADVHYYANMVRGIDTSGVLIMEYPSFIAVCVGAKDCAAPLAVNIQGDKGCLFSNESSSIYSSFSVKLNGETAEEYALNRGRHRMYYELRTFADMVLADDLSKARACNEQSLTVMEILDEARRQVGLLK